MINKATTDKKSLSTTKMAVFIRVKNGMVFVTVQGSSVMQMEDSMMESGNKEPWMVKESCTIQMKNLLMKENGKIILSMGRELFIMKIHKNLKEHLITRTFVLSLRIGSSMRESFIMMRRMV